MDGSLRPRPDRNRRPLPGEERSGKEDRPPGTARCAPEGPTLGADRRQVRNGVSGGCRQGGAERVTEGILRRRPDRNRRPPPGRNAFAAGETLPGAAWFSLEDLLPVPGDEVEVREEFRLLRRAQRTATGVDELAERFAAAAEPPGDEQRETVAGDRFEPDGAPIKGAVVEGAEREAVGDRVRPAMGMPADVRRVETEEVVGEADVVVADGAAPLVRREHRVPEPGITPTPRRAVERRVFLDDGVVEADLVPDRLVERFREVVGQKPRRRLFHEFPVPEQQPLHRLGKPAPDPVLAKVLRAKIAPTRRRQILESWNFPQTIGQEPVERMLRVMCLPRRPEAFQEFPQRRFDLPAVTPEPGRLAHQSAERQQQQQRLVRRPCAGLLPDAEFVEPSEKNLAGHRPAPSALPLTRLSGKVVLLASFGPSQGRRHGSQRAPATQPTVHQQHTAVAPRTNLTMSFLGRTTRSIQELFLQKVFRVPDYQRGYSWEESNIKDFLDDLEYLRSDKSHYTGTLVLHADADDTALLNATATSMRRFAIVDGQQRLTTIVMLLDAIGRELARLDRDSAITDHIRQTFVETQALDGRTIYRLTLNSGTDKFFHQNILRDPPSLQGPTIASEKRLYLAQKHIHEHLTRKLSSLDQNGAHGFLLDLYRKVSERLRFSVYEVEKEGDVGVIFEVMNDRGKPLTELEKVKNYLLYASATIGDHDLASAVNDAWSNMLSLLMRAELEASQDEDELLRTHWTVMYDYQRRNWKGARTVKKRFDIRTHDRGPDLNARLTEYTRGLEITNIPFCDAYSPTMTGSFASFDHQSELKDQVVEWSGKLLRLGRLATFSPLLVAVRRRYPHDAGKYLETLQLCEKYAFRVFALRAARADAGQATLFWVANQLATRTKQMTFARVREIVKSEMNYRCDNAEFKSLLDYPRWGADWYGWRGLRYFLYEYEICLSEKYRSRPVTWNEVADRQKEATVEHILPQNIESIPYWTDRFNHEQHGELLHDLGNLTLTRYNSKLSNRPFPEKKGDSTTAEHCYMNSPFYGERELCQFENWTPATIKTRREALLKWARDRWAVDLVGVGERMGDVGAEDDSVVVDE